MPERFTPQEQVTTPEKSAEELYLDALEKKRNTLLAFHTMNSFRKSRSPEDMSSEEIEQYKVLREEWRSKKEASMNLWDTLAEDKQQELAAMGSRLYDVQAQLTLLRKPKEEVSAGEAVVSPTTEEMTEEINEQAQEEVPPTSPEPAEPESTEKESTPLALEKPESALSLADIEDRIARLEKSSPQPLLAIEAWKAKRDELQERQEAEANPDQTPSKGFAQKVRDAFNKAEESVMGANRISGGSETVESRMSPLGLRKEALSGVEEKTTKTKVQPEPVLELEPKKPTKWGWFKERAKGVWNFGIWEFHQAERFRSKTKEVANEAKALATLIQEERTLSLEEAQKEASEIMSALKERGMESSAVEITKLSNEISEEKRKENDEEIEYIIQTVSNRLPDELKKYRGEAGQDVLTAENKIAFQNDLRAELNKLRDGFLKNYTVDLAKVMRNNLDENWWRRYIWGAAEAALGFAGVKFLVLQYEAIQAAKLAAAEKAVVGGADAGIAAAQESLTGHLRQSIWQDLANSGVPTERLPELTDQVLKSNNLSDRILEGVKGGLDAWRLPKDFIVDYNSIGKQLADLGVDLAKLGVR